MGVKRLELVLITVVGTACLVVIFYSKFIELARSIGYALLVNYIGL